MCALLLSASCVCTSENSATCANCRLLLPLPFPPRRPPRASVVLTSKPDSTNSAIMVLVGKTQCMARIQVSPSTLQYMHPAFRQLILRRNVRRRFGRRNISMAAKIRNRWLRYNILPRVSPFFCTNCGSASVSLKKIKDHLDAKSCKKKITSATDLERETKVAQMGVRSRCKDAMAVLERIPNPQSIRLPKFRVLECEPSFIRHQVPPLSMLAYDSLKKWDREMPCSSSLLYEEVPNCSLNDSPSSKNCNSTVPVVLQCKSCHILFHTNHSYDEHLLRGDCSSGPDQPILVEVDSDSAVPVDYKLGRRISKCYLENRVGLWCTACEAKSDAFETIGKFHEHIMNCKKSSPECEENCWNRSSFLLLVFSSELLSHTVAGKLPKGI